jgi:hypothetical protein
MRGALALVALGLLVLEGTGCGSATAVQCRVEAVRFLPDDPMQVTVFDTVDLVERLKACDGRPATADAGKP